MHAPRAIRASRLPPACLPACLPTYYYYFYHLPTCHKVVDLGHAHAMHMPCTRATYLTHLPGTFLFLLLALLSSRWSTWGMRVSCLPSSSYEHLLAPNPNPNPTKVVDLGHARELSEGGRAYTMLGTPE